MNTIDCSPIVFMRASFWVFVWKPSMNLREALGRSIRSLRRHRGLSQEAFDVVSSRTYISTLERGLKSPTLEKLDEIAKIMDVHPAALLCLTYSLMSESEASAQIEAIRTEARRLLAIYKKGAKG
ncbi:helix-turn-helix transcriptional regulator [Niveibacterium sp. SC-1]|uniref:helix-turn-helix domain-containing protein n=1 Tax=Niveibacterium sp. SC-1 TaxID=3135646 RepID=UPI00311F1DB7